jgi:hypothetical protein
MADQPDTVVAAVLRAARAGDREAAARRLPLAYAGLRRLAQARMAQLPPGQALRPTALVHEATSRDAAGSVDPGPYDIFLHESGRYPLLTGEEIREIIKKG